MMMKKVIEKSYIKMLAGRDARVYNALNDVECNDKTFTHIGFLGITRKYTQEETRNAYLLGMTLGMLEGLRMGSVEGQKRDIGNSCHTSKQKEFFSKFLNLAREYNCAITYHPLKGMCVEDLSYRNT